MHSSIVTRHPQQQNLSPLLVPYGLRRHKMPLFVYVHAVVACRTIFSRCEHHLLLEAVHRENAVYFPLDLFFGRGNGTLQVRYLRKEYSTSTYRMRSVRR